MQKDTRLVAEKNRPPRAAILSEVLVVANDDGGFDARAETRVSVHRLCSTIADVMIFVKSIMQAIAGLHAPTHAAAGNAPTHS